MTNSIPKDWSEKILEMVKDNNAPCLVQLNSFSKDKYPETRTVQLRYLEEKKSLFICTNMGFPKWNQIQNHPYISCGTFLESLGLGIRLKADVECFSNDTEFTIEAWRSISNLHREKFLCMAKNPIKNQVSPIFGCLKLFPRSWIFNETGEDGWTKRQFIYNFDSDGQWVVA